MCAGMTERECVHMVVCAAAATRCGDACVHVWQARKGLVAPVRGGLCVCVFSEMGGNNGDMSVQTNASTRGTAQERDVRVATGWNGVSNRGNMCVCEGGYSREEGLLSVGEDFCECECECECVHGREQQRRAVCAQMQQAGSQAGSICEGCVNESVGVHTYVCGM